MNRHSFRWTGLAFGALFLSISGNWAVWRGDLLTGREMSYLASGVLIVAGLLGVLATFRPPTSAPSSDPGPSGQSPIGQSPIGQSPIGQRESDTTADPVTTDPVTTEENP